MSGTTTRLGLVTSAGVDSMAADVVNLANNYDKVDVNCGCVLVGTLGSVAAPFDGMHVRNAADNKNYFRINGAWVESNAAVIGNTALGGVTDTTSETVFTTTEAKLAQVTFNAAVGRRYLVEASIDYYSVDTSSNNSVTTRIRYASGATVTTAGSLIISKVAGYTSDAGTRNIMVEFFPNTTAQFSVGVFAVRSAGSDSFSASRNSCDSNIWVMDWGT